MSKHTPFRDEAAGIFRQEGVCPYADSMAELPEDAYAQDPNKVEHYAYLGRVIDWGVEEFFAAHDRNPEPIVTTDTPAQLSAAISDGFADVFGRLGTEVPAELAEEWEYLSDSQAHRHELFVLRHPTIERAMRTGYRNFSQITTPFLYDSLTEVYGVELGGKPENWPVLYDVASLNARQLNAFGNYFLVRNPGALEDVIEIVGEDERERLRFEGDFPEGVKVPGVFAPEDANLPADQYGRVELADIPGGPTVGCPIIFKPKHVRDLWALYAGQRSRMQEDSE